MTSPDPLCRTSLAATLTKTREPFLAIRCFRRADLILESARRSRRVYTEPRSRHIYDRYTSEYGEDVRPCRERYACRMAPNRCEPASTSRRRRYSPTLSARAIETHYPMWWMTMRQFRKMHSPNEANESASASTARGALVSLLPYRLSKRSSDLTPVSYRRRCPGYPVRMQARVGLEATFHNGSDEKCVQQLEKGANVALLTRRARILVKSLGKRGMRSRVPIFKPDRTI
jgi:hypothetical protein